MTYTEMGEVTRFRELEQRCWEFAGSNQHLPASTGSEHDEN